MMRALVWLVVVAVVGGVVAGCGDDDGNGTTGGTNNGTNEARPEGLTCLDGKWSDDNHPEQWVCWPDVECALKQSVRCNTDSDCAEWPQTSCLQGFNVCAVVCLEHSECPTGICGTNNDPNVPYFCYDQGIFEDPQCLLEASVTESNPTSCSVKRQGADYTPCLEYTTGPNTAADFGPYTRWPSIR